MIDHREAVFEAIADIAGAPNYDPYASLVMGLIFSATSKKWSLNSGAVYTKPVTNPLVYQNLLAVPYIANTQKITSLSALVAEAPTPKLYVISFSLQTLF
jgi:hypothetical protein